MELGMFTVSGHGVLYACAILLAAAILYACETLPQCVSPLLLRPHSVGNEILVAVAAFLLFFGFFGIVFLMIPDSTEDLSMAFAIVGGCLSFVFTEKNK